MDTGYASRAATLKNCQQPDGSPPDALLATIETAFKRVYRAVAFDIDGTLTTENTSDVDPRAAEAIGALLQRGVHVFLVTGRGHSSTRKAALFIKEDARLTDWYLRRLACVVLNGVVLITTNSESPDRFLEEEQSLAPEITCLPELMKSVADALASRAPEAAHVEKKPNSLRIVIHDNDRTELVRTIITDCLHSFESLANGLHLSIGKYAITRSFSVASTNKRLALASIATKYGISPDHILRIGDQGHDGGNDFELLDSPAGFSVGTVSESHVGCIPVLDESLNTILQAAPAMRRLTSMLNLFPSISMSPAWTERHTRTLLTFEKLAFLTTSRCLTRRRRRGPTALDGAELSSTRFSGTARQTARRCPFECQFFRPSMTGDSPRPSFPRRLLHAEQAGIDAPNRPVRLVDVHLDEEREYVVGHGT